MLEPARSLDVILETDVLVVERPGGLPPRLPQPGPAPARR